MSNERTFEDAFNLLCGEKLGSGVFRDVFECRIQPELVVKVEKDREWRTFHNVKEMEFWRCFSAVAQVARWLAPCSRISPDGRILLQKRAAVLTPTDDLPDKMPTFLTDMKPENFGILDGRMVCIDYALTITDAPLRQRKAKWRLTS